MKRSSRRKFNSKIESKLNFIKLSFAGLLIILLAAIPFLIRSFSDPRKSLDIRGDAGEQEGLIQSWMVSPNGTEIVSGNTEIQFFAKNGTNPSAKFSFTVDLVKGTQFVKNLFTVGIDQQITDRNGIRSKFYDFSGVAEATDYKLKLTTTDSSGTNAVVDYSDNFFTISPNNAKPVFTTTPPTRTLIVGQQFVYDFAVKDITNNVKVITHQSTLPSWLTLSETRISGTPTVPGIYSIALVAVNDLGRQTPQVFSINVVKASASATATPTKTSNVTPVPTGGKTGQSEFEALASAITLRLPTGDRLSKANSTIESVLPNELKGRVKLVTVEMSKDGSSWTKVYEGSNLSFDLDTNKYEGGDYYLRVKYTFDDGSEHLKSYGPIHVIKQNADQMMLDVTIKDMQPVDGAKVYDRKQTIGATFIKPAGAAINVNSFKLEIDGQTIAANAISSSSTGFTYTPAEELSFGKHSVKVTIAAENAQPTIKTWTFEVVDQAAEAAKNKDNSIVTRNRILIAVVLGLIILIFLLALWAIAFTKKEQEYYLIKEEKKIIEQSPIKAE
jgi:hypothetical protein